MKKYKTLFVGQTIVNIYEDKELYEKHKKDSDKDKILKYFNDDDKLLVLDITEWNKKCNEAFNKLAFATFNIKNK